MKLSDLDRQVAIIAARNAREHLDLDENSPVLDIVSVIKNNGGYKYCEDSFEDNFFGFCKYLGIGEYIIGFNKSKEFNAVFKRFTIAHELGHLSIPSHLELLHKEKSHFSLSITNPRSKVELQANSFAANFLSPYEGVKEIIEGSKSSIDAVKKVANYYQISELSSIYRISNVSKKIMTFIEIKDKKISKNFRTDDFYRAYPHKRIHGKRIMMDEIIIPNNGAHTMSQSLLNKWYPNLDPNIRIIETVIDLGFEERLGVLIEVI